uniref:Uncharacterized protein n=1 Tax=Sparus aurata TaxID=8175 RepID=A0A671W7D7_SPAAU
MDQCFRIAVWMFFLVGYLQASPVPGCSMNMDDLSFDVLLDVKCVSYFMIKRFGDAEKKCDSSQIRPTEETLQWGLTRKQCMPQFANFVNATKKFVEDFNIYQQLKKK